MIHSRRLATVSMLASCTLAISLADKNSSHETIEHVVSRETYSQYNISPSVKEKRRKGGGVCVSCGFLGMENGSGT